MIYLDSNSTTNISPFVLQKLTEAYNLGFINPSSVHQHGKIAKKLLDESKERILKSLNATNHDVIFTSSGTETNNLALYGKNCLISPIEHESIYYQPIQKTLLTTNHTGQITINNILPQHEILSIMLANNITGVIQNEEALFSQNLPIPIHSDFSQYIGKKYTDLTQSPFDAITITGHKIHAPHGIGCLVFKKNFKINKHIHGGGQSNNMRAGTYNLPSIVALSYAIELTNTHHYLDEYHHHNTKLIKKLHDFIQNENGTVINADSPKISNTLCFAKQGITSSEQVMMMSVNNISVSAGSACSAGINSKPYMIEAMGYTKEICNSIIRVSTDMHNTEQDIEKFCKIWKTL